ncbi:nucleotidyltransferase domain-containing protein [Candidatus Woesearchaeota archaeon]|nr:nucleotidyltransferase domain-containing protein [Candidatus Woesearchaeota archaeon]
MGQRNQKMGQRNQKMERVMDIIFENPQKSFTVRELSHQLKIPKSTMARYLDSLKDDAIIDNKNKLIENEYTKFLKSAYCIKKLFTSGLISHLQSTLIPSAIILFGSIRKGEFEKNSDIDLFVETTKKSDIDFSAYEKKLNHKVHLFIDSDINNLPKELYNNIMNGIKLTGYIKVK